MNKTLVLFVLLGVSLSFLVEVEGKINTKLLVFVPTHAGDDRRDILRNTWLTDEKDRYSKCDCWFV